MKTIIENTRNKAILLVLSLGLSSGFISQGMGQSLGSVDFGTLPKDTNLGTSLNVLGGAVTITARTMINDAQPYVLGAAGSVGTIFNAYDASPFKEGLGVQTIDKKGSQGISGAGGHQNEELIFTYNQGGALANSISLQINALDFGSAALKNSFANLSGSDPVMWINYNMGSTLALSELDIFNASTALGTVKTGDILGMKGVQYSDSDSYRVNFANIAGLAPGATVNSFVLRETTGHSYVKAFNGGNVVPEPGSAMLILGAAAGALLITRRRDMM
jgi:hypothetical protein